METAVREPIDWPYTEKHSSVEEREKTVRGKHSLFSQWYWGKKMKKGTVIPRNAPYLLEVGMRKEAGTSFDYYALGHQFKREPRTVWNTVQDARKLS